MRNNFYQLADGLLIGSSSSPCFNDTYIRHYEKISIHVMHTPRIWLSTVGDTFVIIHHDKNNILAKLKINQKQPSGVFCNKRCS